MTQFSASADPLADILAAHGTPSPATLADDIAGTYLQIAESFGVRAAALPLSKRAAGASVHVDLAALAAAAGDSLSTREHYLTAARLASAAGGEIAAITGADAQLVMRPGDDCVYAVYDLSAGPVTFDFIYFLMMAEHFRATTGRLGLFVLFVPAPGDGFRRASPRDHFLTQDRKLWRLLNLLAPCAALVPHCVGMHVCASRADAAELLREAAPDRVFPPQFSLDNPTCPYSLPQILQCAQHGPDIRALRAPPLAAALVQRWLRELGGGKPVVSITLRQSDFQPARNSDLAAWRQFAGACTRMGFHPVFIPDTESLLNGQQAALDGFTTLALPALSVGYRLAIYETCFLNMLTNNGPAALCMFHPSARSQIFKMIVASVPTCSAQFFISQGLLPGAQLPFAGAGQTITWQDDDADSLERSFVAAVEAVLAVPAPSFSAAAG
jgi:hypothetical protein